MTMKPGEDLSEDALRAILGERALQSHPVVLSAASSAAEWARAGAPDGALVVADYQISPRGRAGRPWKVTQGRGLGFALVLRPQLSADREGFLYTLVVRALADVCGDGVTIEWPDEVRRDDALLAATGIDIRLGPQRVMWAAVNVLMPEAAPPRGELLKSVVQAIEARGAASPGEVRADYDPICATIGRRVRVALLGGARKFEGTAIETTDDGALVLDVGEERQVPVRPQDVGAIQTVPALDSDERGRPSWRPSA